MQAACEKLPVSPAESLPQLAGLVHAMNVYAGPSEPGPGLCQASFNDLFTSRLRSFWGKGKEIQRAN
jgi:hypothetical protein